MPAIGSMAVWCQSRPQAPPSKAEVHFNYWRLAGQANFTGKRDYPAEDFAEIGIFLKSPSLVETVSIYLPLHLDAPRIKDCGPYFAGVEIAQGIFNEVLACNSVGPPGPRRVELRKNDQRFCRVHIFPTDEQSDIDAAQLSIEPEGNGTLLKISRTAIDEVCAGLAEECPAYFRLRAYMPEMACSPFVSIIAPLDRGFQSGFDEVEYIDYRLNEARTLPSNVERLMREQRDGISFPLVAFLTAFPVTSDLTASSQEANKKRLLEHKLWDPYVPSGIPEGMVVYHWRKERDEGVADFSAFVKLRTRRSSKKILITYLAIAFVFGVLGNLVASGIESLWSKTRAETPTLSEIPAPTFTQSDGGPQ